MADYKDFDINTATTLKPWGPREEQCVKDVIDTLVLDTIGSVKNTSGHLHGKLYAGDSVSSIDSATSNSVSIIMRDDESAGLVIKNRTGTSIVEIDSSTTTPKVTSNYDTDVVGKLYGDIYDLYDNPMIVTRHQTSTINFTPDKTAGHDFNLDPATLQFRIHNDSTELFRIDTPVFDAAATFEIPVNVNGSLSVVGGTLIVEDTHQTELTGNNINFKRDGTTYITADEGSSSALSIQVSDFIRLRNNGVETLRADANNNISLAKSNLETWLDTLTALQIGGNSSVVSTTAEGVATRLYMINNMYRDASDWKTLTTDESSMIVLGDGNIDFYTYPNSTADAAFTPALRMRIDEDGKVGLGTDSPEGKLHVFNGSAGSVSPNTAADELVLENNGQCGMTILTPDSSQGIIAYGTESDSYSAAIVYNDNDTTLTIGTRLTGGEVSIGSADNTEALRIDVDQKATFNYDADVVGKLYGDIYDLYDNPMIVTRHQTSTINFTPDKTAGHDFNLDPATLQFRIHNDSTELFRIDTPVSNATATFEIPVYIDESLSVVGGDVGIGTDSPDGRLHVYNGSAGSVSPNTAADELVLENNDNCGMSILSPDADYSQVYFGSPTNASAAVLQWNHSNNLCRLGTLNSGAEIAILTDNGTEALRIDDSGNVGIGTASPNHKLDVNGSIEYSDYSRHFDDYSVATATNVPIYVYDGTYNMVSSHSYQVTLRTLSTGTMTGAKYLVEFDGSVFISHLVSAEGTGSNHPLLTISGNTMYVYHNHASTYTIRATVERLNGGNTSNATSRMWGTEAILTLLGDKLGVGIDSPDGRLHVYNGSAGTVSPDNTGDELTLENSSHVGMTMLSPDANFSSVYFGSPSDNRGAKVDWCYDNLEMSVGTRHVGGKLLLLSNSEDVAVTIDDDGDVGIGETNPAFKLDIAGDARISDSNFTLSSKSGGLLLRGDTAGEDNYSAAVIFGFNTGKSGIVGKQIGSDNDSIGLAFFTHYSNSGAVDCEEVLTIVGSSTASTYMGPAGDDDLLRLSSGSLAINGTVFLNSISGTTGGSDLRYNTSTKEVFYDTSALKYKENIRKDVNTEWIYNVPVVMYDRKDGIRANEIGIIADDLEKVAPSFCSYNEIGEVESYNKSDLVPVLVAEIQNHEKEIKQLKQEILNLKKAA
jgi:hypothetical protein